MMVSINWRTLWKAPRRIRLSVISRNQRSTRFSHDQLEEPDPLLMAMARHAIPNDLAIEHAQGGKQGRRAIALVIVCHRAAPTLLERKARLGAAQRVNLALLLAAQDQRMFRWIEIQTHDIQQLLDELGITAELERLGQVGLGLMGLPYAMDQG